MDEPHLLAAFAYIALNPVKVGFLAHARQWTWSSALAHLEGKNDPYVDVQPLLERVDNVAEFCSTPASVEWEQALMAGQTVGRPLVDDQTTGALEHQLGRKLKPGKRGRPAKRNS